MTKLPTPHPARGQRVPLHVQARAHTGEGAGSRRHGLSVSPGGGGGGGFPLPAQRAPSIDIPVPWQVRPPGAREIYAQGDATGFNAAGTPAVIPGSQFTLPANHVGILRSVVLSVNTMLITSALTWTFRQDGIPIEGWGQLTIFPRAAGSVAEAFGPEETFIFLPEGGVTIDVFFNVTDAAAYQAGVSYHGWSYPKAAWDQFQGLY